MGHPDYRNCRDCGKRVDPPQTLSWSRRCPACASANLESNIDQMHARSGPNFTLWRKRMAACVGAVLLDESTPPR